LHFRDATLKLSRVQNTGLEIVVSQTKSQELTAAIIAGGKSQRFGAPKALARIGGKRLIDYALETAHAISAQVILNAPDIPEFERISDITLLPDSIPHCGPLGGIFTVLTNAETPWVAVLPCDMPLLSPAVYQYLWEHRGKNPVIAAVSHKGVEPLVSIWQKSFTPVLERNLNQKELALHTLLKKTGGALLPLPGKMPGYRKEFFLNVNYREDLQRILNFFSGKM